MYDSALYYVHDIHVAYIGCYLFIFSSEHSSWMFSTGEYSREKYVCLRYVNVCKGM